jgi:hypothetical protein
MTQTVQTQRAFAGDVPANLRCGFCGQPVQGHFYRAANRFTCDNCAAQIQRAIGQNSVGPGTFLAAGVAGLIWIAFAGFAAWRMCKPANISIAGPYQHKPAASGLQFDTVEPLQPPGNS